MWAEAPLRAKPHTREPNSELLRALLDPASYPDRPASIELRETHISWVFLTPKLVYKVKKPVRFSFLDFSTLQKRRQAAEAELRLNRRLAPNVYLGVWPIQRDRTGRIRVGNVGGETIEYAVVMRRLPEDRMMDRLLAAGRVQMRQIDQLAELLADFYRSARRSERLDQYAEPQAVRANAADNLEQLLRNPDLFGCDLLRRLESAQLQFPTVRSDVFQRRLREGWVCEGHGDLRPEHICLTEPPVVYDCVEFSEAFRAADVLNDLAFLAMELDAAGHPQLAERLIGRFARRYPGVLDRPLLAYYKAYRALVRAKVALLRAAQERDPTAAQRDRSTARRYAELAAYYDHAYHRPLIVAVIGPSGTGKTTLAYELAGAVGAPVLRSDVVRQQLAGRRDPDAAYEAGLYAPSFTRRVYQELLRRALRCARDWRTSVVVDATFAHRWQRDALRRAARESNIEYCFLYCAAPATVAIGRVAARRARGTDISDARPEIVTRQYALFALASDLTRSDVWRLDAAAPLEQLRGQAVEALRAVVTSH